MAQVDSGSVLEDLDVADAVTHGETLGLTRIELVALVAAAAAGEDGSLCQTRVVDFHPSSI